MSGSKRIAKNTLLLYFRMFLIMGVTLYTSRVILEQLGVSDYGIYSLVGGIVAMLGFFNAAMSSATQRYLSFDIGKGNEERLQKTFSATLSIHFLIAILALILAETIGLWYINYKMVFPNERIYAVNVVYQFSVLTFLLNIIQVPYNALIIARERMNVYAYVSILEVIFKLLIVFLLVYGDDKLVLYSILTFFVALVIRMIYQVYCRKYFIESRFRFEWDKKYYSELLSYSGWNLFGNFVGIAKQQGVNVILNLIFGTVLNAAYGITMQVQSAILMFVSNFQMAINPSIVKEYAAGNHNQVTKLLFVGTKFSFLLLCIILIPISFNLEIILRFWLGESVPELTKEFIQLTFLVILIDSLSGPIMTLVTATGNIKYYHLILSTINFWSLPFMYFVVLKTENSLYMFYVLIGFSILMFISRIIYVNRYCSFDILDYIKDVLFRIGVISLLYCVFYKFIFESFLVNVCRLNELTFFIITSLVLIIVFFIIAMCFGLNKIERNYVKGILVNIKSKVC